MQCSSRSTRTPPEFIIMAKASPTALLREIEAASLTISSPSFSRIRQKALAILRQEDLLEPAYCYRIVPLERIEGANFFVEGEILHAPSLFPESGELTALAFGVITLGDRLEARISDLFRQRKASLAVALDDMANELMMGLSRRVEDRLMADVLRQRLTMAGELHAGDPGLDLAAQASVARLARGESIGVRLHNGHLLTPIKSGSVVFGVGRNLPVANWSRCDRCPSKAKCKFARTETTHIPLVTA